jgi:hypothetical protein
MSYSVSSVQVADGQRMLTKKSVQPTHQLKGSHDMNSYQTFDFASAPASHFTSNGAKHVGLVQRGTFGQCDHVMIKAKVTVTGSASVLAPVYNWWDRIDLRQSGSNDILQTWYPDTIMASIYSLMSEHQLKAFLRDVNVDGEEDNFLGFQSAIPAGQSKTFYMPLAGSFFNTLHANYSEAKSDLYFEFTPAQSIVKSGGGVVTLNQLALLIETQNKPMSSQMRDYVFSTQYLDPVPVFRPSFNVVAGDNSIELSSIQGKVSHLQMILRPAGTQPKDYHTMVSLGEASTIDLLNPSNQSILGTGQPIDTLVLRNEIISAHHLQNSVFSTIHKPCYLVPLTSSIQGALKGYVSGVWQFQGDKDQIRFNVASGAQNEVQTLALASGANATTGWFRIAYKANRTSALPFNASAGQIKSAIEALPEFQKRSITVSVANGFNANAGSVAVTIFNPEASGSTETERFDVLSSMDTFVNTTQTTPPVHTIAPGLYDVTVFAYVYKTASYMNGRFVSQLL